MSVAAPQLGANFSEYLLLADIHIASGRAAHGDLPHPAFGITGGDGV